MNKHINKIIDGSCDKDIITKVHNDNIKKASIQIDKAPKHNAHKEHKKTFNEVLIQIKSCNKALKQINNISFYP